MLKRWLQLALAVALGLGWARPVFGQNECPAGQQSIQQTRDRAGIVHQVECYDPGTGQVSWPYLNSIIVNNLASFTGITAQILCKNLENIRCASGFTPAADWCSKVTAADADLGTTSGEIWVDTSAGTALCASPPTLSANHVLRFINGNVYNTPCGWTITNQSNFAIAGLPGKLTTIQFAGTCTNGLFVDGSALGNQIFGVKIVDLTFSGGPGITNVVTLKGVSRSYFDFSARNSTGVAVNLVGSQFDDGRIVVSSNEGSFSPQPTGCILFDRYTVPSTIQSNGDRIYVICEGISGVGVEYKFATNNELWGTSEGNTGTGIQIDAGANNTTLHGMDLESNSVQDILMNGSNLHIESTLCLSTVRVHVGTTGSNVFAGPQDPTVGCLPSTIDAGGGGFYKNDAPALGSTIAEILYTNSGGQTVSNKKLLLADGTACANGQFGLSAGWGASATVTAATGFGQSCYITVTSAGAGQATNATITWTLPTAMANSTTPCSADLKGGTGIAALSGAGLFMNQTTFSATAPVFTWPGLPVAASTYVVLLRCGP